MRRNAGWHPLTDDVPLAAGGRHGRRTPDAYDQGGLFARYLIRTQGIDAWVRYYRQAPERRDPALFAANFSAFWNMNIDDVWTAMHAVVPAPPPRTRDLPLLAAGAADRRPTGRQRCRRHPYWCCRTPGARPWRSSRPPAGAFFVSDCAGIAPFASGGSTLQTSDSLGPVAHRRGDRVRSVSVRRAERSHYIISAPITSASVGRYIADSCDATVPYQLPTDFLDGSGELSIIVDQTTVGAVTKYVQVQVAGVGIASLGPGGGRLRQLCVRPGGLRSDDLGRPSAVLEGRPGPLNVEWHVPRDRAGGLPALSVTGGVDPIHGMSGWEAQVNRLRSVSLRWRRFRSRAGLCGAGEGRGAHRRACRKPPPPDGRDQLRLPASPDRRSGKRVHDGFFLRLSLGAVYLHESWTPPVAVPGPCYGGWGTSLEPRSASAFVRG